MISRELDLTIAIPVKNEERNLPGCLAAIGTGLAQRVVVIDSGSTDRTKEIAENFGAEVVDFVWDGRFPKKRNWFLRNHTPATKWVLFLDADEYLTEAFKKELRTRLTESDHDGFLLNYTVYFMGRKLKGGYPLRKLALFRVGAGEYEQIEEEHWSQLDMEVHEHPVLKGSVGIIRSRIDHKDLRGVSHYVLKHTEYASWEAGRFMNESCKKKMCNLTWPKLLKYKLMNSIWFGPAFFLGCFFLYGGFRDGSRGLAYAFLRMSYYTQVYCKIRALLEEQEQRDPNGVRLLTSHQDIRPVSSKQVI